MSAAEVTLVSSDSDATCALAAALARICRPGDCIALRGDLGSGKTTFARGFIRALSPEAGEIVSPTFTLVQPYPGQGGSTLWHFDLYRLKNAAEAEEIGLHDALSQPGITLIEWPERVEGQLPADTLDICLSMGNHPGERVLTLAGNAAAWADRLAIVKGNAVTKTIAPARLEQICGFLQGTAFAGAELHPLAGDASFRRYIRVSKGGKTAMLMDAPPEKENVRPYLAVAEYLVKQGFSAPKVLAREIPAGLLLLEDLGDDSFTLVLKNAGGEKDKRERELYEAAIDVLAAWHDSKKRFTDRDALPLPHYNEQLLMQEVCLFTDWYLPQVLGKDEAEALRNEYVALWRDIFKNAPLQTDIWVHRDYHADNLMWLPERQGTARVGLLDFQDGVYGDAAYDMVSLLEDARRDVPQAVVDAMLARYLSDTGTDKARFMTAYAVLGAQRNSKIIGIFSRLAARDNKFAYLQFLPRVWRYLEQDLKHPALAPLKAWMDKHVPSGQRGVISVRHTSQELARTA